MRLCTALAVLAIAFGAGCGGSGSAEIKDTSVNDTSGYRAAVNEVFNPLLAARQAYGLAHGDAALRRAALAFQRSDEAGLSKLRALNVPAGAKALQAQLTKSLAAQAAAMKAVLAAPKLDTAKLGDGVLLSNDAEAVVSQINALP
jgi:hypothetical protein